MKCPKCQSENSDNARFCSHCAAPLTAPGSARPSFTETMETPREKLARGTLFAGRYEIIEELGRGGMGAVYRVDDTKAREEIALKLIKPEIASDKKVIERFRQEMTTARKISHRYVGRMFDLGESEGTHFITMEYIPGEDMKSLIRRVGRLDSATAVKIGKQICEGMSEAHQLGIVHRDLKPGNIMIDKNGNARIMDFGIARSAAEKRITGMGVLIGTPEYMSPEQAEAKEIDPRSDIYSLGVILYEMTTGRLPFEGDTPLSIAMKHKAESPRNPRDLNPRIPESLNGFILKCIEKEKERRYPTAMHAHADLESIAQGLPAAEKAVPRRKAGTSKEITVSFDPKKILIPVSIVAVLAIIILAAFVKRGSKLDPNLIAVADFENKTGDKTLDTVGPMAADWIRQGLLQTGIVKVVPTFSTGLSSPEIPGEDRIRHIAQETGAGVVVSGAYYLQGETIRLNAQITDARAGKILSSLEPVSGPAADPVKSIESLRQQLMGALAIDLDPTIGNYLDFAGHSPPKYEAYQEYLKGLLSWADQYEVIEHFNRAAEIDDTFILPLLHVATVYGNVDNFAKAEALCRRVEMSREKLTKSDLLWLDWLQARHRGDLLGMLRADRQQVLIYPSSIWLNQTGMDALSNNFPQEAIRAFEKLDIEKEGEGFEEWSRYWNDLTLAYHMLGQHKRELKKARRGRRQYPELPSMLFCEARALTGLRKMDAVHALMGECLHMPSRAGWSPGRVMRNTALWLRAHEYRTDSIKIAEQAASYYRSRREGDYREALAFSLYLAERWGEAEDLYKLLRQEGSDGGTDRGVLGTIAARLGKRDEADRISRELRDLDDPFLFGRPQLWRARIAALLGEKEQAMELLREALNKGVSFRTLYSDMDLEPLRDYPAFIDLKKPRG